MSPRLKILLGIMCSSLVILIGQNVPVVPAFSLLRGPYLQNVQQTSAIVRFDTSVGVVGTVKYTDGATTGSVTEPRPAQSHIITLKNLLPGTVYKYSITFSPTAKEPKYSFKTSPADGFTGKMRFAHLSDSGWDRYTYKIPVLNQLTKWNAEFVIHSGDVNVYNGLQQDYNQRFFDPYRNILHTMPFYPVMGNHDAIAKWPFLMNFSLPYKESGSPVENFYSFDKGSVHFIGLDTNYAYAPGSAQLLWLEKDLQNRDLIARPWTIVYFHHPVFSTSMHGSTPDVQKYIEPLLEQYGATLVLNGHDHTYQRFGPYNGVTYVVGGGGGQGPYPCGVTAIPQVPVKCVSINFFIGFIATPGKLNVKVIDLKGNLIDKFKFYKK